MPIARPPVPAGRGAPAPARSALLRVRAVGRVARRAAAASSRMARASRKPQWARRSGRDAAGGAEERRRSSRGERHHAARIGVVWCTARSTAARSTVARSTDARTAQPGGAHRRAAVAARRCIVRGGRRGIMRAACAWAARRGAAGACARTAWHRSRRAGGGRRGAGAPQRQISRVHRARIAQRL